MNQRDKRNGDWNKALDRTCSRCSRSGADARRQGIAVLAVRLLVVNPPLEMQVAAAGHEPTTKGATS